MNSSWRVLACATAIVAGGFLFVEEGNAATADPVNQTSTVSATR